MERHGAREVVAIDHRFSFEQVKMFELNLFDSTPETYGTFDVVCFSVNAHYLRYPFWALKIVRDVLRCDEALILNQRFN